MAKLTSLLKFSGTLEDLTAYEADGKTLLRKKGGPTRQQVLHGSNFVNTRRNNKETGGRSRASGLVLATFGGLRSVVDQSCAGRINRVLKVVQVADSQSPWGQRHVRLSQWPALLEGLAIREKYPLQSWLRSPLACSVDKAALRAEVQVPALLPGVNLLAPAGYPLYRVVAALGVVPDLYFDPHLNIYTPPAGFSRVLTQTALTEWYGVKSGSEATTLSIQLPKDPGTTDFSLVLTVGVQWGTMGIGGSVEIEGKLKSARIEKVV